MRIFLLTLLTALVIAPAQASAASTGCDVDPGPYAPASHDQTVVSNTDWQKGNPLGSIKVPLVGTEVDAFEYSVDCGAPVVVNAASSSATITGEGELRFRHRARVKADAIPDGGLWTDWVEETVRIDSGRPANETPIITSEIAPGPSFPVRATDTTSPVHAEWQVVLNGLSGPFPWNTSDTAIVDGTGRYTLNTRAVDSAGNEFQAPFTVNIDNDAPVARPRRRPSTGSRTRSTSWSTAPTHTPAWTTSNGRSTPKTLAPRGRGRTARSSGSERRASTCFVPGSSTRSQRLRVAHAGRVGQHGGTDRHDGRGHDGYTTPTVDIDITGTDNVGRDLALIEWRLDGKPGGKVSNPVNSTVPA